MDDTICPRCKTTKFQNPSLKMMVNVCGHALCESCVDLLFLKGSGACPECRIPLRRTNFRVQLFEDASVEKEVDIRKRVLRDYTKKEDDFSSTADYNDYLEEIETVVYNLTHDVDIVNTNKRIEEYKRNNREQIMKSKGKLGRDECELEGILEMEKHQDSVRKTEIKLEDMEAKRRKLREKEALIDELMFSNVSAQNIIETFAQNAKESRELEAKQAPAKATKFSTGIQFGQQPQSGFLPIPIEEGPPFVYKAPVFVINGPRPPAPVEITSKGFTNHVRAETEVERAGGFQASIPCMRALQDAFAGLYHVKKIVL